MFRVGESSCPVRLWRIIPAQAGIPKPLYGRQTSNGKDSWIPAFAGMTGWAGQEIPSTLNCYDWGTGQSQVKEPLNKPLPPSRADKGFYIARSPPAPPRPHPGAATVGADFLQYRFDGRTLPGKDGPPLRPVAGDFTAGKRSATARTRPHPGPLLGKRWAVLARRWRTLPGNLMAKPALAVISGASSRPRPNGWTRPLGRTWKGWGLVNIWIHCNLLKALMGTLYNVVIREVGRGLPLCG